MKRIISIVLTVMLVVSAVAVSAGAVEYKPTDSYTVTPDTPTCLEALNACKTADPAWNGEYHTVYFQAPENWYNAYNKLEIYNDGQDDAGNYIVKQYPEETHLDYGQICVYWWAGAGSKWPDGTEQKWVGYKCELVDKANRIFAAQLPVADDTPMVIFNNGVNGGPTSEDPMRKYAAQIEDTNIQGALEDEYDTLPEGSPNEDNFAGCICVPDPTRTSINEYSQVLTSGINWYVYYGKGCYGMYSTDSDNFVSKYDNCCNPEHLADPEKYHPTPGDVNQDKVTDVLDAELIQKYLVKLEELTDIQKQIADVDEDSYISIIDATRIQRYIAGLCEIDGTPINNK